MEIEKSEKERDSHSLTSFSQTVSNNLRYQRNIKIFCNGFFFLLTLLWRGFWIIIILSFLVEILKVTSPSFKKIFNIGDGLLMNSCQRGQRAFNPGALLSIVFLILLLPSPASYESNIRGIVIKRGSRCG